MTGLVEIAGGLDVGIVNTGPQDNCAEEVSYHSIELGIDEVRQCGFQSLAQWM